MSLNVAICHGTQKLRSFPSFSDFQMYQDPWYVISLKIYQRSEDSPSLGSNAFLEKGLKIVEAWGVRSNIFPQL